jgi:hypothetical protein
VADCKYEVVSIGYPGVVIGGWPLHEPRNLRRALKRLGKKRWSRHVANVVERFKVVLEADYFVIGGATPRNLGKCRRVPVSAQTPTPSPAGFGSGERPSLRES